MVSSMTVDTRILSVNKTIFLTDHDTYAKHKGKRIINNIYSKTLSQPYGLRIAYKRYLITGTLGLHEPSIMILKFLLLLPYFITVH